MKKISILFFTFIVIKSYSQVDRVNAELPKIQLTSTKVLTKSMGYSYNESGQWVSAENKIPYPNNTQVEIDNFVSYDFREIKIKDSLYTLFMKKYNTGWHTYPSIKEGWNNTISAEWFVLEKRKIDEIKVYSDSINLIKLNSIYHGWIDNAPMHKKWNNSTYISEIQNEISKQQIQGKGDNTSLVLHILPYKSKNLVRYNFYSLSPYNSVWMISNNYEPKDPNGKYSFSTLKIFGTNILFNYCYFETDIISFGKLIPIQ